MAVWRGQIIGGRHRYEVCTGLGVEPEYLFLDDGADPLAFVISKNAVRRHLDETQSAVIAFRLAQASGPSGQCEGVPEGEIFPRQLTQREAARLMGVSDRLVKHAAKVLSPESKAVPELREAVAAGTVRISDASRIVSDSEEVQRNAVGKVLAGEAKTVTGAARSIRGQLAHADGELSLRRASRTPPAKRLPCIPSGWDVCTVRQNRPTPSSQVIHRLRRAAVREPIPQGEGGYAGGGANGQDGGGGAVLIDLFAVAGGRKVWGLH